MFVEYHVTNSFLKSFEASEYIHLNTGYKKLDLSLANMEVQGPKHGLVKY